MKKLKVIQIIDSLNIGGAEVMAVNIANLLSEKDIQSYICVTRKEGLLKESLSSNVGYLFLKKSKRIDFIAIYKLYHYIKKNNINIIHAHSSSYFIASCIKLLNIKIKIIWHDHYGKSDFLTKFSRLPIQFISSFFNAVIAVNSKLLKWSKDNLSVRYIVFLQNFPVFNDFTKSTFLKGEEGKRIIHLAGFREQKDHLNLLKAFMIVLKDKPKFTLHLVGKVYEGEYSYNIIKFIQQNNISNNVFIYGVCSDIKNILNQSSIGVLSSKSEGLPISLLEYGLAGLPVVVTNVGECANVVKNEKMIVPVERSDKLAEAILYLINDKVLNAKLAFDFNKEVNSKYSKEVVINKLIYIYKNIND